jgi:hypothetical protein
MSTPSPSHTPIIVSHTPLHGWLVLIGVFAAFAFLGYVRLQFNQRHRR